MAFQDREISNDSGKPVGLYQFRWGNSFWRYTSSDQPVTVTQQNDEGEDEEVTYTPLAIGDSGMTQGTSETNDLTITMDRLAEPLNLFVGTPPSDSVWITVRKIHYGDTEALVTWVGFIGNVKPTDLVQAQVIGRSLLSSFSRDGLRCAWTRSCPYVVYDGDCTLDPADFATEVTITAINGNTITISDDGGHPLDYFSGGFFEWVADANGTKDYRSIKSSIDTTNLVIFGSADRLSVGMTIILHPGCNLTTTICEGRFNNLANFGGFEQMSGDSPFDGNPIF